MDFNTTYYWAIVAWDSHGYSTIGPEWYFTTTNQATNRPPTRPVIEGVIGLIVPNRAYDYNFTSNDPDQDDVYYYVDWGDGTFEDWTGPSTSGQSIAIEHIWPAKTKIYQIKAKAKDTYGSESDYGTFLVFVLSPRNTGASIFVRIIQRLPILQKMIILLPLIHKMMRL
jgi:hypothetical protein